MSLQGVDAAGVSVVDGVTVVIAALALVVSIVTFALQRRVRGPSLRFVNDGEAQRCKIIPYSGLPAYVPGRFPNYYGADTGCILFDLLFSNEGDRAGYAHVSHVEVKAVAAAGGRGDAPGPEPRLERIRPVFYSYCKVPAQSIGELDVLLENVPEEMSRCGLTIQVTYDVPHPARAKALRGVRQTRTGTVVLELERPRDERPAVGPGATRIADAATAPPLEPGR